MTNLIGQLFYLVFRILYFILNLQLASRNLHLILTTIH